MNSFEETPFANPQGVFYALDLKAGESHRIAGLQDVLGPSRTPTTAFRRRRWLEEWSG